MPSARAEREETLALLEPPEFPPAVGYLLEWHQELQLARRYGERGLEPLSWAELDAWARLTNRSPDPDEVEALMHLDASVRFPEEPKQEEAE